MPSFPSFAFESFELNTFTRRLTREGQPVPIADRHFDVLYRLIGSSGELVTKDALVNAGWGDVAVTDNSLEQAISALRRALGPRADGSHYIETVPRRGYRFNGSVERRIAKASDADLEAMMAPHRAWIEGRAALESLEGERISRARRDFEQVLEAFPDHATAHIGLANAYAMRYEMTRADAQRDVTSLEKAAEHAREACRLDPNLAEAWATLGFVHHCASDPVAALAALRRAITTEPDNWRHHFRLAYAGWGEERLRAARKTLSMLPGFPLAHWLAATVHVARNVLDEAERELRTGLVGQDSQAPHARFNAVALHWLLGLVLLAKGDENGALAEFDRELAAEGSGQLYARECCANTWYAIGALRMRQKRAVEAQQAFAQVLERVPNHRLVQGVLVAQSMAGLQSTYGAGVPAGFSVAKGTFDERFGASIVLDLMGQTAFAAQTIDAALTEAPPGNAGWLLPVEPLLNVPANADTWAAALSRLRARAT
ncbi:MAG TPA: winged helix-turn-helix domain-containing protein [Vicinamibacterales bacterium]|nr:winged helix-turn-helix domain-containing protein [Vicinamibacterales bacterium]